MFPRFSVHALTAIYFLMATPSFAQDVRSYSFTKQACVRPVDVDIDLIQIYNQDVRNELHCANICTSSCAGDADCVRSECFAVLINSAEDGSKECIKTSSLVGLPELILENCDNPEYTASVWTQDITEEETPTTAAPEPCNPDWPYLEESHSCYVVHNTYMNCTAAREVCEAEGGFLAEPKSESQNSFVLDVSNTQNIWIGINDIQKEGRYVWQDDVEPTFTKWDNDEPSGSPDENCVHMRTNLFWNDASCEDPKTFPFVCQRYEV